MYRYIKFCFKNGMFLDAFLPTEAILHITFELSADTKLCPRLDINLKGAN